MKVMGALWPVSRMSKVSPLSLCKNKWQIKRQDNQKAPFTPYRLPSNLNVLCRQHKASIWKVNTKSTQFTQKSSWKSNFKTTFPRVNWSSPFLQTLTAKESSRPVRVQVDRAPFSFSPAIPSWSSRLSGVTRNKSWSRCLITTLLISRKCPTRLYQRYMEFTL